MFEALFVRQWWPPFGQQIPVRRLRVQNCCADPSFAGLHSPIRRARCTSVIVMFFAPITIAIRPLNALVAELRPRGPATPKCRCLRIRSNDFAPATFLRWLGLFICGCSEQATEALAENLCERVKLGQAEISGGTSSSVVGRPSIFRWCSQYKSIRPSYYS